VLWHDGDSSVLAYSDLFSPGLLPMVLPVPPGTQLGVQEVRRGARTRVGHF
jgi:hypothetical protein